jgi:hypothetical protein
MAAACVSFKLTKLLHASRGVVKGNGLHLRMRGQESPALPERHGMRIHAVDLIHLRAGDGDQVVPDANQRLPHHLHVVMKQQVEMFEHRSRQAVLNGNRRGIGCA